MAKPDPQPDDFAPGQLRNGFNMIVRDLDRAFAAAALGTYEVFVLQHVREESWTASLRGKRKGDPLPEPKPCKLNLSALADAADMNRRLLSRALNNLVAYRILTRLEDGSVLINKNYFGWVYPGENGQADRPRFTDKQIVFIQAFPGSVTKERRPPKSVEETLSVLAQLLPVSGNSDGDSATQEWQLDGEVPPTSGSQLPPRSGGSDGGCHSGVAVGATQEWQSHIEERARGEFREKNSSSGRRAASRNPERPYAADLEKLQRLALATFGARYELESLDEAIEPWLVAGFPAEWIERFLLAAKHSADGPIGAYVNTCLFNERTDQANGVRRGRGKPRDSPTSNPNLFRFEVTTPAAEESPFTRAHRERAEKLATEQAAQRQKGN